MNDEAMPLLHWRRLLAAAIDGVLLNQLGFEFFPFGGLLLTGYFVVGTRYRTVGQLVTRVRAVDAGTGQRARWSQAFWRSLPWLMLIALGNWPMFGTKFVSLALVGLAGLETYLYRWSDWTQGVGDLIAGTAVVPANREATPVPAATA